MNLLVIIECLDIHFFIASFAKKGRKKNGHRQRELWKAIWDVRLFCSFHSINLNNRSFLTPEEHNGSLFFSPPVLMQVGSRQRQVAFLIG